jgi:NADH-quinone oxidoreductase subunit J
MPIAFYVASGVAIAATVLVITRLNGVHALLYLILSLLAVAVVFLTLAAPFVAALEVIIYAGAIMVLFVFVVMMLNQGSRTTDQERRWFRPAMLALPAVLGLFLVGQLVYVGWQTGGGAGAGPSSPQDVGTALFGPYVFGVEIAAMLLLAGLVGALHFGRRDREGEE